jgi:hypothetical protein
MGHESAKTTLQSYAKPDGGGAFGQTPKYWLNLQAMHDLTRTRPVRPVARMPEALKAAG